MVKKRFFVALALAFLLILTLVFAKVYFYPARSADTVDVLIERGDTTSVIGAKLDAAGVITSSFLFRALASMQGRGGDFKPGLYRLNRGLHYGEVFAVLERGPVAMGTLTIPEGYTLEQIAAKVGSETHITQADFTREARAGELPAGYLATGMGAGLEGFLFPKTYEIDGGLTAGSLVQFMVQQFDREASSLDWTRAAALGVSPYQAVIIASMIEREARLDEERPIVAAVIYNRLRIGMRLQIDATVQYALPQWKDVVTGEDLKVDSPYNTYLHAGLPPGPICNPGLESLDAALHPADVDYLYYVAQGDSGAHYFTDDYQDFLNHQ
ncbi:MAG: endolytic transglycosylase MltG [Candidatus Geothermincolia bacterium]